MRILRPLILGGITLLSTVAICFVAADRVTHGSYPAPTPTTLAKAAPATDKAVEPETTGTVTQGAEAVEAQASRKLDGFDTERLNALMRGELPPAPVRTASKKR